MSNLSNIETPSILPNATRGAMPAGETSRESANGSKARVLVPTCAAILVAIAASHLAAAWFGLQTGKPTYRRIGPQTGSQVFVAGSSLLQFGLSWREISEVLGQGLECWAIGGSSPDVWEAYQPLATNSTSLIVGFSAYDLNDERLCDHRAGIVPLKQTVQDLWRIKAGWTYCKRVLSQYPLAWLRALFPTAGKSDAVLVGMRRKLRELSRISATAEEKANAFVLPTEPILEFGDTAEKLSEWPVDKRLRRLALVRNEIRGAHRFDGLQRLALLRMLDRVPREGQIIIVVMPVAPTYARELLRTDDLRNLDALLLEAQRVAPRTRIVRLDQLPALKSDHYFSDFIHLNGAGKRIATEAFLKDLK
jgi:hypothetical protein